MNVHQAQARGCGQCYSLQQQHRYRISVQCCVTDYRKCRCPEQHAFAIPQFLWVRSPDTAQLGPPRGCNQGVSQDGLLILARLGKGPLPSLFSLFGRIHVLGTIRLMAACFFKAGMVSDMESSVK